MRPLAEVPLLVLHIPTCKPQLLCDTLNFQQNKVQASPSSGWVCAVLGSLRGSCRALRPSGCHTVWGRLWLSTATRRPPLRLVGFEYPVKTQNIRRLNSYLHILIFLASLNTYQNPKVLHEEFSISFGISSISKLLIAVIDPNNVAKRQVRSHSGDSPW